MFLGFKEKQDKEANCYVLESQNENPTRTQRVRKFIGFNSMSTEAFFLLFVCYLFYFVFERMCHDTNFVCIVAFCQAAVILKHVINENLVVKLNTDPIDREIKVYDADRSHLKTIEQGELY